MVQDGALTALASVADSSQVCLLLIFKYFIVLLLWVCQALFFAWTGALPEVL